MGQMNEYFGEGVPIEGNQELIENLQQLIADLEEEEKGLPGSAETWTEGEKRLKEVRANLETYHTAIEDVRTSIESRKEEGKREEQRRRQRQEQDYTSRLLKDAAAFKGSALSHNQINQVGRVIRSRIPLRYHIHGDPSRQARGASQITDPFVRSWQSAIGEQQREGVSTFSEFVKPIGPPAPKDLGPTQPPQPQPDIGPATPWNELTDFPISNDQRETLRDIVVTMTDLETDPTRVTDAILDNVIRHIRTSESLNGRLPITTEDIGQIFQALTGEIRTDGLSELNSHRYWNFDASINSTDGVMDLQDEINDLAIMDKDGDLDPDRIEMKISQELSRIIKNEGAWGDDEVRPGELAAHVAGIAQRIYGDIVGDLLGLPMDMLNNPRAWGSKINEYVRTKAKEVIESGGLSNHMKAPLSTIQKVRQHISASGLLPDDPTDEWRTQIEPIATAVEKAMNDLKIAGKDQKTIDEETPGIIARVVEKRLKSEADIISTNEAERLAGIDLRTRFDAVSGRPKRLTFEHTDDIDFLLNRAFEISKRRYNTAVALDEKPSFEAIATKEVAKAKSQVGQISGAAAATFGAQPPGMVDRRTPRKKGEEIPEDEAAFIEEFFDEWGRYPGEGEGGNWAMDVRLHETWKRQEAHKKQVDIDRQKTVDEQQREREQLGEDPMSDEEIEDFMASPYTVDEQRKPEGLTPKQVAETPSGQAQMAATSRDFSREGIRAIQRGEAQRLEEERKRLALEKEERQKLEAQPRRIGGRVR